jgi:1,6-anhydro-N-acetylmuramate kinase
MDGIDAALIETDGESHLTIGPHTSMRYPPEVRRVLLQLSTDSPLACSLMWGLRKTLAGWVMP